MKGSATLELNEATVIEALQEWLDKRWADNDEVRAVAIREIEQKMSGRWFKVDLSAPEKPDPDKVKIV